MSSKKGFYYLLTFVIFFSCFIIIIKNSEEERTKSLEHIILQPNSSKLILEYSNKTQNIIDNPFNSNFQIISQDGILINNKDIFNIHQNNSLKKSGTLDGTIYYYKDKSNYIIDRSGRYLGVVSDDIETNYYFFDRQFNHLNCLQIIKYQESILCLSSNLGMIYELHTTEAASKNILFEKSGYLINGIYNYNGNLLIIYNLQDTTDLKTIAKINDKELNLPGNFVYQVTFKNNTYFISTISESNLSNKIYNFEIFSLSTKGDLIKISENSSGVYLY